MSDAKWLKPYHFKKGHTGNPNGRPAYKDGIRKVTPEWAAELAHYCFHEPEAEFMRWLTEEPRTMAEKLTAKLIQKVYLTGDAASFKILLESLVGKPKEIAEVKHVDSTESLAAVTDEELERRERLLSESGV